MNKYGDNKTDLINKHEDMINKDKEIIKVKKIHDEEIINKEK